MIIIDTRTQVEKQIEQQLSAVGAISALWSIYILYHVI